MKISMKVVNIRLYDSLKQRNVNLIVLYCLRDWHLHHLIIKLRLFLYYQLNLIDLLYLVFVVKNSKQPTKLAIINGVHPKLSSISISAFLLINSQTRDE